MADETISPPSTIPKGAAAKSAAAGKAGQKGRGRGAKGF